MAARNAGNIVQRRPTETATGVAGAVVIIAAWAFNIKDPQVLAAMTLVVAAVPVFVSTVADRFFPEKEAPAVTKLKKSLADKSSAVTQLKKSLGVESSAVTELTNSLSALTGENKQLRRQLDRSSDGIPTPFKTEFAEIDKELRKIERIVSTK